MKNSVNEALERGRRVHAAKRHDVELVKLAVDYESGLLLVFLSDSNLPEGAIDIERGEELRTAERIDRTVNQWQGVRVLGCNRIHTLQIDTEPISDYSVWVFLLDEKNWRAPRARGLVRGPSRKHLIGLLSERSSSNLRDRVLALLDRRVITSRNAMFN